MFVVRKIFMDYVVPDKKEGVFFCIADIVTNITHFCKLQINVTMRLLQGDLITL